MTRDEQVRVLHHLGLCDNAWSYWPDDRMARYFAAIISGHDPQAEEREARRLELEREMKLLLKFVEQEEMR